MKITKEDFKEFQNGGDKLSRIKKGYIRNNHPWLKERFGEGESL